MKKNECDVLTSISLEEAKATMLDILVKIDAICEKNDIRYSLLAGTLLGAIRHDGFIPWDDDIDIMMPYQDLLKFVEIAPKELGEEYFLQTPNSDHKYDILHVPYKVRNNNSTLVEEYNKNYHQGIYVDIFPFDFMGEDEESYLKFKKRASFITSLKMRISFKEQSGIKRYIRIMLQLICKLIPTRVFFNYLGKKEQKYISQESCSKRVSMGYTCIDKEIFNVNDIFPLKKKSFEGYEFNIANNYDAILTTQYGPNYMTPPEKPQAFHGIFYDNKRHY